MALIATRQIGNKIKKHHELHGAFNHFGKQILISCYRIIF